MFQSNKWVLLPDRIITYSFPTSRTHYDGSFSYPSFYTFTAQQRLAVREIFDEIERFSNVEFVEIAPDALNPATLRMGNHGGDTSHGAYPHSTDPGAGDLWIHTNPAHQMQAPIRGKYSWQIHAHEIGHTLGLKHGHQTGTGGQPIIPIFGSSPGGYTLDRNYNEYTLMTYVTTGSQTVITNSQLIFASNSYNHTYRGLDVWALQHLYGARVNGDNRTLKWSPTNGSVLVNGSARYTANSTPGVPFANKVAETIAYPTTGILTLDFSDYTSNINADLRADGGISLFPNTSLPASPNFSATNIYQILYTSSGYPAYGYHITFPPYLNGDWLAKAIKLGSGTNAVHMHSGVLSVDGGSGTNTVHLHNDFANYNVTDNGDGTFTIEDLGTPDPAIDGVLTAQNVQTFQFQDGPKTPSDFITSGIAINGSRFTNTPTFYASDVSQAGSQAIVGSRLNNETFFPPSTLDSEFTTVLFRWS